MKCPRCGGEIPAFDLKPNCKHCGVNILFYTQQSQLALDAKRTELEAAAARMVIARIKMNFIGGKLQIARIVLTVLAAAALLVPFGSVRFTVPYFTQTFSAGLIGFIQAFQSGFLMQLPSFLNSALLSRQTLAAVIPTAFLLLCAVLDVLLLAALLLGFLNLTRSARFARGASLVGAILCAAAQIVQLLLCVRTPKTPLAAASVGFGALAAAVIYAALFFLNRALLKGGLQPQYRENDPRRKELLRQVRAGEVSLDTLPLPIFESEQEREERLHALEEALRAEEEGREE